MAKRFIDTEMFNDDWFAELSKDAKLFFIYYITSCDHAGVLRLNKKLCEFQTGIKDVDLTIEEFDNCLITVTKEYSNSLIFFMPKFIRFQYPNFPKSAVKQQDSAIKILKSLGFWNEETNCYITVSKELDNTYVYVNDSVSEVNINKKERKKIFVAPTLDEFKTYFLQNGFSLELAERAWKGYDSAQWHDSNGNKVRNWKQKCHNVWFKSENKEAQNNQKTVENYEQAAMSLILKHGTKKD